MADLKEGWSPHDGLELQELTAVERIKAIEFAALYVQAFEHNPAGAKLLDYWIKTTIMRPTVLGRSHAEDGIREGRADFVRGILQQIEIAKRGAT